MHALNRLFAHINRRGHGSNKAQQLAEHQVEHQAEHQVDSAGQKIRVNDSPDSARRQRPQLCARPWLQTQTVFQQIGATRWAVPVYVRTVR